jgi:hypothetical protein
MVQVVAFTHYAGLEAPIVERCGASPAWHARAPQHHRRRDGRDCRPSHPSNDRPSSPPRCGVGQILKLVGSRRAWLLKMLMAEACVDAADIGFVPTGIAGGIRAAAVV